MDPREEDPGIKCNAVSFYCVFFSLYLLSSECMYVCPSFLFVFVLFPLWPQLARQLPTLLSLRSCDAQGSAVLTAAARISSSDAVLKAQWSQNVQFSPAAVLRDAPGDHCSANAVVPACVNSSSTVAGSSSESWVSCAFKSPAPSHQNPVFHSQMFRLVHCEYL